MGYRLASEECLATRAPWAYGSSTTIRVSVLSQHILLLGTQTWTNVTLTIVPSQMGCISSRARQLIATSEPGVITPYQVQP